MTQKCAERIGAELKARLDDLRKLYALYLQDPESEDYDLGNLLDYGLSFDYVRGNGGKSGYFRWQLSWGGPSDEFRFYTDPEFNLDRVEYAFMDWFDGARQELTGEAFKLLQDIWETMFQEFAPLFFQKAMEEA